MFANFAIVQTCWWSDTHSLSCSWSKTVRARNRRRTEGSATDRNGTPPLRTETHPYSLSRKVKGPREASRPRESAFVWSRHTIIEGLKWRARFFLSFFFLALFRIYRYPLPIASFPLLSAVIASLWLLQQHISARQVHNTKRCMCRIKQRTFRTTTIALIPN